jgi:hypothetical protein
MRRAVLLAFAAALLLGAGSSRGTGRLVPLLGADYTHVAFPRCDLNGYGIVQYGFAQRVRRQLAAMHAAGLRSLRLLLWHQHDPGQASWGVVPSASGRLEEPYRTNLVHYLDAVREVGFRRLIVSFGPMGTNDPVGYPQDYWDPAMLEENWAFVQNVRPLVKEHGPSETRIDLINEAPPASWMPPERVDRIESYLAQIYGRYLAAYGSEDVSFSVIAKGAFDAQDRLSHLIEALQRRSLPLPGWIDLHPSYSGSALDDLRSDERVLAGAGWHPEIVLAESVYEQPAAANAIARFVRSTDLPVTEIDQWPQRREPCSPGVPFSVSPPFRADAYFRAFTGKPAPSTLRGRVTQTGTTLVTPYDRPVTALTAGGWRLVVQDASRTSGFRLRGPKIDLRTGVRFRGARSWRLRLGAGQYRYPGGSFVVLKAG